MKLETLKAFDLVTDPKEEYPATALRNTWNAAPAETGRHDERRVHGQIVHKLRAAGEGTVGMAMARQGIEPFEVGRDSFSQVSPDYQRKGSFPFTGAIERIQFDVIPGT